MILNSKSEPISYHSICIFSIIFLAGDYVFNEACCSLDCSTYLSINIALHHNLSFGDDFVLTYGPMGFLATRMVTYIPFIVFFISDLFHTIFLYIVIYKLLSYTKSHWKYLFWFGFFTTLRMNYAYLYYEISFYEYLLLLALTILYEKEKKDIYLAAIIILCIIGLYIKLNIGLLFGFTFFFYIFYLVFSRQITLLKAFILIGAYCILLFSISYFLKVNLIAYVYNNLFIIDGYVDAMFGEGDFTSTFTFLTFLFQIFLFGILVLANFLSQYLIRKDIRVINFFLPIAILLGTFVIYKQVTTRFNTHAFPKFGFSYFLLLFFILDSKIYKYILSTFQLFVFVFSIYVVIIVINSNDEIFDIFNYNIGKKISRLSNYHKDFKKRSKTPKYSAECCLLPDDVKNTIGNASVDVIPIEISTVYFNKLNYNPRPVVQSYSAYHNKLDKLNEAKYLSSNAPDYVFYTLFSIDNRYFMHDETYTKLALMSNYKISKTAIPYVYNNFILFKKDSVLNPYNLHRVKDTKLKFDTFYNIDPSDNLQLLRTDIKYSLWGEIRRMFFHPAFIKIEFLFEDGSSRQYRSILTNNNSGILINRFIENFYNSCESELFFKYYGLYNKKIKAFKFTTEYPEIYEPEFNAEINEVIFAENRYKSEDSSYEKIDLNKLNLTNNQFIKGNLEGLDSTQKYYAVKGWATITNTACCNSLNLVLSNASGTSYKIPGNLLMRYDIAQSLNLGSSNISTGFNSIIIYDNAPAGDYTLSLLITDSEEKKYLIPVNKSIKIAK